MHIAHSTDNYTCDAFGNPNQLIKASVNMLSNVKKPFKHLPR